MSIGRARFFSSGKKRKPQTAFVKNSQSASPLCAFCALFYLITFFAALQSFCKNSAQGIFASAAGRLLFLGRRFFFLPPIGVDTAAVILAVKAVFV